MTESYDYSDSKNMRRKFIYSHAANALVKSVNRRRGQLKIGSTSEVLKGVSSCIQP
jgi:hypothetical protein